MERGRGVIADRDDRVRLQCIEQPGQEPLPDPAFRRRMGAVAHGVPVIMGMQWEEIPQKHGSPHAAQHAPDDGGRALADRRAGSRLSKRQAAPRLAEMPEVDLIGQRQPGTPSAYLSVIT